MARDRVVTDQNDAEDAPGGDAVAGKAAPGSRPKKATAAGGAIGDAAIRLGRTAPGGAGSVLVRQAQTGDDDERMARDLRPRRFAEYVGQRTVVDPLSIAVKAAERRGEPLDHVLFHGPPGLGKTTLARIIAREMDAHLTHTSGPALERPGDVVGLLSNLKKGDVLFIDEIHRLSSAVEEYLYSAMEDFRVDFVTGSGAFAKTISLPLEKFTLIGSTTRAGMLSAPLRDRFGITYHMEYYADDELTQVVKRSSGILGVKIEADAAAEIARRSRGTPRIANRLLRRVRDFAEVGGAAGPEALEGRGAGTSSGHSVLRQAQDGAIRQAQDSAASGTGGGAIPGTDVAVSKAMAAEALRLEGVDELGLDRLDRMYLQTLAVNYQGGPAGVEALAASLNEEQQTLVDVVEPFLLKIGFIVRTPGGRKATQAGMAHAGASASGKAAKDAGQGRLV